MLRLVAIWLGVSLLVSGCRPDAVTEPFECDEDSDCHSRICVIVSTSRSTFGRCSRLCTTDADCERGLVCGVEPGGEMACVLPCSSERYACVGGVSMACEAVRDERVCDACPEVCRDPDPRCVPGVGCTSHSDVDGPCLEDNDCVTGNCSRFAGVCRVPLGQPCTATDCDACITHPDGWSWCSRDCVEGEACQRGACLTEGSVVNYFCRPDCGGCPGECGTSVDTREPFCSCSECRELTAGRPIGAPCRDDAMCASASCIESQNCFDGNCVTRGWCSAPCASDTDCNGGRCVVLPCDPARPERECGLVCLPGCDPGDFFDSCQIRDDRETCDELVHISGAAVHVCTPDSLGGIYCDVDAECASGHCDDGRCDDPPSSLANGAACSEPMECASSQCVDRVCRGTSLLGDPCASSWDCLVGTCCSTGSAAGSCGSACP